jgi:hypothetical protein
LVQKQQEYDENYTSASPSVSWWIVPKTFQVFKTWKVWFVTKLIHHFILGEALVRLLKP